MKLKSEAGEQRPLRVGMIGCGEVAYSLTGKAVTAAQGVRLVRAMDADESLARSFGETFKVPHTARLDDILDDPEIDAVIISTPHVEHEPLTRLAAAAGKHIMCEKPIACSLDQADRMIEACDATGVHFGVNMVARYESVTRHAHELVRSGAIGDVIGLNIHFTVKKPASYWNGGFTSRAPSAWRKSWQSAGGGVLMINIIHELDRLCFIAGVEPAAVSAEIGTYCSNIEVEDSACAVYLFSNGAIGTITASSCAHGNRSFGGQVIGSHGQIVLGTFAARLLLGAAKRRGYSYMLRRVLPERLINWALRPELEVYTVKDVPGLRAGRWNRLCAPLTGDARRLYIEAFARSVREHRPPEVDGIQGRRILEAVLAAYGSTQTKTRWPIGQSTAGAVLEVGPAEAGHRELSLTGADAQGARPAWGPVESTLS